jgi:hypothetical protein
MIKKIASTLKPRVKTILGTVGILDEATAIYSRIISFLKPDAFLQFQKLMKRSATYSKNELSDQKKILFFAYSSATRLIFDLLIAKRLQLFENVSPVFFVCDGLPICNLRSVNFPGDNNFCNRCKDNATKYIKAAGFPIETLSSWVGRADCEEAEISSNSLSYDECRTFIYEGIPLGKLL